MSSQQPGISEQEGTISYYINGMILQSMLWGFYTIVYISTLYVYSTRKASKNWFIIGAITVSYITFSFQSALSWYLFQHAFVYSSETRATLFVALVEEIPWLTFVDNLIFFVMAALADGILIWRCFYVWDRSLPAISIPSVLLLCEIVVDLVALILECATHFHPSANQAVLLDRLIGTQAFITFGTTLTATLLISYPIYRASRADTTSSSKRRFKQVLEIVVQSSAIYSLAALANAIPSVIPLTSGNTTEVYAASTYAATLFYFTAGSAPTIMVARVAFLDGRRKELSTSTFTARVSGLRFHVQSTTQQGGSGGVAEDVATVDNLHVPDFLSEKEGVNLASSV